MMEFSVPVKFALVIMMVLITQKQYRVLYDIKSISTKDAILAGAGCALSSFIAGALMHSALLQVLKEAL